MKLFVIGDPHLGLSVDKPMELFGKRWDNHVERMEINWNKHVSPEDTVIVAGDISWGLRLEEAAEDLRFLHRLPGRKILLRGNHDYWWSTLSKLKTFTEEENLNSLHFLQNNAIPVGSDFVVAGTRSWIKPDDPEFNEQDRKIDARELIRLQLSLEEAKPYQEEGRRLVVVTHYPPMNRDISPGPWTRAIRNAGAWQAFFGHIHQTRSPYCFSGRIVDEVPYSLISADYLGFNPHLVE